MTKNRRSALVALVTALVLLPTPAVGATSAPAVAAPGCVATADPAEAARRLLHPDATVTGVDRVRGRETALASVPIVMPGARHRLVRVGGTWCDALAGFNATPATDAVEAASMFASVAAARYFDQVTVRDARLTAPGVVQLTTHARTNGVVAQWRVVVDDRGVRQASWKATEFAVAPFEGDLHGPTALPGATIDYARGDTGLLAAVNDPFTAKAAPPTVGTSVIETSDGFKIIVSRGHAPYAYSTSRTGVATVDVNELAVRTARENYEDFVSWGLKRGWNGPGHVFIDGGLSAVCMACVLNEPNSKVFNVHMLSAFAEYAELLGYTYPDPELFFSTVMGHEIFHNFQIANGSGNFSSAFVEGTARFQETLHDYSRVSHQPGSLVYGNDGSGNGCNDYITALEYRLAWHTYDACFAWMSVYVDHGLDALVAIVETDSRRISLETAIENATGVPLETTMSRVAMRALTGDGLVWGPATGAGPALDWSQYLDRWTPAPLAPSSRTLDSGAITGGSIAAATPVSLSATGPGGFAVVRRDQAGTSITPVAGDAEVAAPAPGEDVWLTAVAGSGGATLRVGLDGSAAPGPTVPVWSDVDDREYKWAPLPTDQASASATSDLATRSFDLKASVAGTPASFYTGPRADAQAYFSGAVTIDPGVYAVVAEIDVDALELTGARGTVGRATSSASASMSIWCMTTSCSVYDSWYARSDTPTSVDHVVLHGTIDVDRAQQLDLNLYATAYAYSSDKSASATLNGRLVELRFTRIA